MPTPAAVSTQLRRETLPVARLCIAETHRGLRTDFWHRLFEVWKKPYIYLTHSSRSWHCFMNHPWGRHMELQWTLDNWNTHGRRKFGPIIKSFQLWKPKCVQNIGKWNWNVFSNRSNYQSVPIIRVPIIEGRLYYFFMYCGGTVGDSLLSCASNPKTSAVSVLILWYDVFNQFICDVICAHCGSRQWPVPCWWVRGVGWCTLGQSGWPVDCEDG